MPVKLCIFNQTTNLIDITDGVSVYTGSDSTAYAPLLLNAEGSLDGSFFPTSTPITATASVSLQAGQLVNIYYSGSAVFAKLASALSTVSPPVAGLPAMGYVAENATVGSTVTINTQGLVNCPFTTGFSPSNIGRPVYLSAAQPGSVQLTAPSNPDLVQALGYIYQVGGVINSYVQFPFLSFPLQVPIATTAVAGIVVPDGVTIEVNGSGVITAIGGGSGSANYTQPPVVSLPTPDGSTTYALGFAPVVPAASFYFVNGIKRVYGVYYSITGSTLTILDANPPDVAEGDTSHELYAS